ncbi:hypothetical protein DRJ17_05470 [Candidatus Woesearchaeota archaeon]|nr:MAG: hypothetical protein DRJ17_05470 [Candidatus Woesearchaeota archaeon]
MAKLRLSVRGVGPFTDRKEYLFSPGVTILEGNNGSGKTSLLKALYVAISWSEDEGKKSVLSSLVNDELKEIEIELFEDKNIINRIRAIKQEDRLILQEAYEQKFPQKIEKYAFVFLENTLLTSAVINNDLTKLLRSYSEELEYPHLIVMRENLEHVLRGVLDRLEETLDKMQTNIRELKKIREKMEELKQQYIEKEHEKGKLEDAKKKLREKMPEEPKKLDEEIDQLRRKKDELLREKSDIEEEIGDLKRKIENIRKDLEVLKNLNEEERGILDHLNQQLAKLNKEKQQKEEARIALEKEIANLQLQRIIYIQFERMIKEFSELMYSSLSESYCPIFYLEKRECPISRDITTKFQSKESFENYLLSLIERQKQEIDKKREEIEKRRAELEMIVNRVRELESKIDELNTKIEQRSKEINEKTKNLRELEARMRELENKHETIRNKIHELSAEIAHLEARRKEVVDKKTEKELAVIEEKIGNIERELRELLEDMRVLQREENNIKEKNQDLLSYLKLLYAEALLLKKAIAIVQEKIKKEEEEFVKKLEEELNKLLAQLNYRGITKIKVNYEPRTRQITYLIFRDGILTDYSSLSTAEKLSITLITIYVLLNTKFQESWKVFILDSYGELLDDTRFQKFLQALNEVARTHSKYIIVTKVASDAEIPRVVTI